MVLLKRLIFIVIFSMLINGSAQAAFPSDDPAWELIAPGIEYQKFQLPDPNNVFVVRMDRTDLGVTLESSVATGKLSEGRETVSGMFTRYDQALNYWGGSGSPPSWAMRNEVIVAINGSYFDWNSGLPQGGQVQSGWYAKRFDDLGGWSGFVWKLDRNAFIGECVDHNPEKQFITFPSTAKTQPFAAINDVRGANELVIFTPQYNSRTGTDDSGVEVLVEMARPAMILPSPSYASGIVRQVFNTKGNNLIPFNSIVLSASGSAAQTLLENAQMGSEIRVSQEITSYDSDCVTPNSLSWTKTYSSIQGAFFFLKNGQIREFDDPGAIERNPRTAILYNDQYIYYLVVDGRDRYHSVGMSIPELALFARDTLGATWGVAQDGGGSSTMVINGVVVNNTFCNIYSCMWKYETFLPMVSHDSERGLFVVPVQRNVISSPAGVERPVANGMLMVRVQPGAYSPAFIPGESVTTIVNTELRLGPGTNYATFTTLPVGTHGIIQPQMNGLDGVLAKSAYWWHVDFGGVLGWVTEGSLAPLGSGAGLSGWFDYIRRYDK